MSGVYSKVNGKFNISQVNSKYNNNWRDTYQIYKKDDSSWEKVYNYWYEYSEWSDCSASCGGGTQTRTATCRRSDGIIKNNDYCRKYGLTTDILIRQCNTQPCVVNFWAGNYYDDGSKIALILNDKSLWVLAQGACGNGGGENSVASVTVATSEFPLRFVAIGCDGSGPGSHIGNLQISVNGVRNYIYSGDGGRIGCCHSSVLYIDVNLDGSWTYRGGYSRSDRWGQFQRFSNYKIGAQTGTIDPWFGIYRHDGGNSLNRI